MPTDTNPPRRAAEDYYDRPMPSSAIPPSSERPYQGARKNSQVGKFLVLGGVGIMAAAATAAAVLAARRLADAVDGDDRGGALARRERHGPRPMAPRFAELDEEAREEIRHRDRERAVRERNRVARMRALAARERVAPRRNIARDMADTATDLSGSLNGVVGSLTGAMAGFRQVAAQAGGVMREFADAADAVRSFLDRPGSRHADDQGPDQTRNPRDADRTHRM